MLRPDFKPLARFKAGQPILKWASCMDRFKAIHESTNLSILVSICDNYHALEVSRTSLALNRAGWPDSKLAAHGPHAHIKAYNLYSLHMATCRVSFEVLVVAVV